MRISKFIFALSFLATVTWAQTPKTVLYRGFLMEDQEAVRPGPYAIRLELFDSLTGGTALKGIETTADITDGSFVVDIAPLFEGTPAEVFLQISVKGPGIDVYDEMPRMQIGAIPFALRAARADSVEWANVLNAPASLQGPKGDVGLYGPCRACWACWTCGACWTFGDRRSPRSRGSRRHSGDRRSGSSWLQLHLRRRRVRLGQWRQLCLQRCSWRGRRPGPAGRAGSQRRHRKPGSHRTRRHPGRVGPARAKGGHGGPGSKRRHGRSRPGRVHRCAGPEGRYWRDGHFRCRRLRTPRRELPLRWRPIHIRTRSQLRVQWRAGRHWPTGVERLSGDVGRRRLGSAGLQLHLRRRQIHLGQRHRLRLQWRSGHRRSPGFSGPQRRHWTDWAQRGHRRPGSSRRRRPSRGHRSSGRHWGPRRDRRSGNVRHQRP